ncbi:ANK_REP_REGION domain-containing protein [Nephila pilipes]|uniref:ANK_REP_REGION domain-containing protein n=1 Tax=Nephila pilipes TaxID=299642 RepID=A0A8X6NF18_NEPPI|nr:ANK_REP_REGION domain-containing protein [Nephila pilipes]
MSFINTFFRNGNTNKNKELERAVNERNCDEIKILLSTGADINHTVNRNLDTMLHTTKSAGITRDLLGYSANVNARNLFEKTPLHSAVIDGKHPEVVKTLLEHAADVDPKDSDGCTPLNYAVKTNRPNVEVIKWLIMYGADIGAGKFESFVVDDHFSPLDIAVLNDDTTSAKILIKYALLKKFCDSFTKVIDLRAYYRWKNYFALKRYLNDCGAEILRMKREKINDKTTLSQVILSNVVPREALYTDEEGLKLFTERSLSIIASNNYPIYCDVISEKLRNRLEVSSLINVLRTVQISFSRKDPNGEKKVVLNLDINPIIAKYMSKNDLFNFILAFYDPIKHSTVQLPIQSNIPKFRAELSKRLCEPSTSSSGVKYIKLA